MRPRSLALLVTALALAASCKRGGGDRGDTPPVSLPPVPGAPVAIRDAQVRLTHSVRIGTGETVRLGSNEEKNAISVGWVNEGTVAAKHSVGAGFVCQIGGYSMRTRRAWITNAAGGADMSASSEPYALVEGAPTACEIDFAYGKSIYDPGEVALPNPTELGRLCWKPGDLAAGACAADRVARAPRGTGPVGIESVTVKSGTTAKGGHGLSLAFLATANVAPARDARVNGWATCTAGAERKTGQVQMLTEIGHLAPGETMEAGGPVFTDVPLAAEPSSCEIVLKRGSPGIDGDDLGTWCWRAGSATAAPGGCG